MRVGVELDGASQPLLAQRGLAEVEWIDALRTPPYSACMFWFFVFFFVSGFCSILYELVWLRLAMAEFGVTTAMVSIVLSVFMAGLGLGSWASGEWIRRHGEKIGFPALRLYAAIELLI